MGGGNAFGGLISSIALGVFAIWLLVTFWAFFAWVGAVALVLWLGWLAWPRVSWWLTIGRIRRQTGRAITRSDVAYERTRERMQRIARSYRRP